VSGRSPAAPCVILLVLVVALTGCATRIRNIPTQPLLKQTNGAAERDHRECEAAITGQLKGVWFPAEIEFASCMIARNYQDRTVPAADHMIRTDEMAVGLAGTPTH